jgi:hypothetical protein
VRRLLVFAILAAAAPLAHAQPMEPGEWEFVTTIAMPGLPRPQQSGYRACLTRDQAKDPLQWGRGPNQPEDCRVTTLKLGPQGTSWEMQCPSTGMRGVGKARFGRGSMESETQIGGGASIDMRMKTQGRRLGPCNP